ncbi:hypothetical protein NDU88_006062 [Pleurodeles waltl]|uniref:Uncharacterized protein n=1 Tax=Pleurodeles waltl TaxID=8319 RepID=A0AAV7TDC6_PLEWA|nr:hypothetical protein NDU88_006062 [Pleurodeles waltl]
MRNVLWFRKVVPGDGGTDAGIAVEEGGEFEMGGASQPGSAHEGSELWSSRLRGPTTPISCRQVREKRPASVCGPGWISREEDPDPGTMCGGSTSENFDAGYRRAKMAAGSML